MKAKEMLPPYMGVLYKFTGTDSPDEFQMFIQSQIDGGFADLPRVPAHIPLLPEDIVGKHIMFWHDAVRYVKTAQVFIEHEEGGFQNKDGVVGIVVLMVRKALDLEAEKKIAKAFDVELVEFPPNTLPEYKILWCAECLKIPGHPWMN